MLNTHTHTLTHSYTCTLTHTVTHSHTHIYADTCSHIVTHAHTYTHRALESILDFWFLIFYHLLCRSQKPQRWQYCHSSQSWWTQRQYRLCYKKKWYASDSLRDWFKSCHTWCPWINIITCHNHLQICPDQKWLWFDQRHDVHIYEVPSLHEEWIRSLLQDASPLLFLMLWSL